MDEEGRRRAPVNATSARAPARVLAIVGATATGKTDLAEAVAERLGGEVVCADSRQVFRELEIGTGKPTEAQRASQPHHLYDLLALGERASAGAFARVAAPTCEAVLARGRVPILVGGSGLYLRALERGLAPTPPHDPELRERLGDEARAVGLEALHARLASLDQETADRLGRRDAQRILRALEVVQATGRPLTSWHRDPVAAPLAVEWRIVELVVPPHSLAGRISVRTRAMLGGGLVEETRALTERGMEDELRKLRAIGYDECLDLIAGRIGLAQAHERIDLRTRQLAKRQRTWFRHQVEALPLDGTLEAPELLRAVIEAALDNPRRH